LNKIELEGHIDIEEDVYSKFSELRKKPKYQYFGVTKSPSNTYRCLVHYNGTTKTVGFFKTEIEAAIAYNKFLADNNLNKTYNVIPKEYSATQDDLSK
jgi:hypothetical protein